MSALNNSLLLGQEGGGGYAISRSLRFSSADSSFLSRTPASAGNRKTWTFSCWLKKCKNSSSEDIFSVSTGTEALRFDSDSVYYFADSGFEALMTTSAVLRDPSAWYHIILSVDTTQATASNRANIYINGVLQTLYLSNRPSLNYNTLLNNAYALRIGGSNYLNGYLADVHFIDGQALDPTSFGEFDANGIWQPKAYSGSYGTNGFHLDFADNSTAAALGTDTSGNGNTWTVNNLSVTAGAGNDSLVDVPTNGTETDTGIGGQVRGNYATWNPLKKYSTVTLSNGNLDNSTTDGKTLATIGMSSGKWYCEVAITSGPVNPGLARDNTQLTAGYLGDDASSWCYASNGSVYTSGGGTSYGNSFTSGDIIGIAFDADAGNLYFYKNGVVQNSGTPAFTGLTNTPYFFAVGAASSTSSVNFGQRPWAYGPAPSGFKALCTANLPAPVVTKPSTVMDVKLYTGNGSTQTISGLGFSPDLVWIKNRSGTYNHVLVDAVRGAAKILYSDLTSAEVDRGSTAYDFTSFNTDGFSVATPNNAAVNNNNVAAVAWAWDAGSSTVTNTAGSITSSVRANPSAGFSIVTYTGDGSTSATVGHGLGVAPVFYVGKNRSASSNWLMLTTATGSMQFGYLNLTDAFGTPTQSAPTSSVINILSAGGETTSGNDYVIYAFAPVAGYSSFGSYVGNGSSDGVFVYTGFRPRWILIKNTTDTGGQNWILHDTARNPYNLADLQLYPSSSNAEYQFAGNARDILSNGFKLRGSNGGTNGSGQTYIYAAFAESCFALNNRAR